MMYLKKIGMRYLIFLVYLFCHCYYTHAQITITPLDQTLKPFWDNHNKVKYIRSYFQYELDSGKISSINPIDQAESYFDENQGLFTINHFKKIPGGGEELWPSKIMNLNLYRNYYQSLNGIKDKLLVIFNMQSDFYKNYNYWFDETNHVVTTTHCYDGKFRRGKGSATIMAVANDHSHIKLATILSCVKDGYLSNTYKYEFLITDIYPIKSVPEQIPSNDSSAARTSVAINPMSNFNPNCITLDEYSKHTKSLEMPYQLNYNWEPTISSGAARKTYSEALIYLKHALETMVNRKDIEFHGRKSSVFEMVQSIAPIYDVSPINVLAALLGEHAFNMNIVDDTQYYIADLRIYKFSSNFNKTMPALYEFIQREKVNCVSSNEYERWSCYDSQWASLYRGKETDYCDSENTTGVCSGRFAVNKGFKWIFFSPFSSGTYGIGQLGPEIALRVADLVAIKNGGHLPYPDNFEIKATHLFYLDPDEVKIDENFMYKSIIDPRLSIHYISALIKRHQDFYLNYANFDIKNNAGLNATLYNLGKGDWKAKEKFINNVNSLKKGKGITDVPELNFVGHLIDQNISYICEMVGFGTDIANCMNAK